jgi:ribosomal protein S18 acetylase RimI-like enzyme
MARAIDFEVRRANLADVDAIAAAHLDSIRSIGPQYYTMEVVSDWGARVKGDLYVNAMRRGEVFYIAVGPTALSRAPSRLAEADGGGGPLDGEPEVLGFSSHRIDGKVHHTAVYVRGKAARLGIGSALFRTAEAAAIAAGATSIEIDASLAAVEFYTANGFEEIGRGAHRLSSGRPMPCVFMRKSLSRLSGRSGRKT